MSESESALQRLRDGNHRFTAHQLTLDVSPHRREAVAQEQKPFAIIFGCVDARVPPELIFDQGLGDLLVIRTAAQVLDQAALESLQFGVTMLKIPLLVVLGHERCGAVKAAIDSLGNSGEAGPDLRFLVDAIAPAVDQARRLGGDLWEQAVRAQAALQVEQLKKAPVFAQVVENGELDIIGAWYSLETGQVEFLA